MFNFIGKLPPPVNEPIHTYAPGTPQRQSLTAELDRQAANHVEIPLIIGGQEIKTGNTVPVVMPHNHGHELGVAHVASPKEIEMAVEASRRAWAVWGRMDWHRRAAVFLKMADLISGPWRDRINAATMLNQSKTVQQAEIDSACEVVDFLRFNAKYAEEIYADQPLSGPGMWNQVDYRPLEGFILAVSPFNFTAIACNLASAPALMGNTLLWKPATTALLSGYTLMQLYREAGLPDGVINFIPSRGSELGRVALAQHVLAGIHFTGSTGVFNGLWRDTAANLSTYRNYPRLVGETGGKDFIFMHPSAHAEEVVAGLVRGAFEYQGQKCSACSRAYIPASRWDEVREGMARTLAGIRMGDVRDFVNFCSAVIDEKSFDNLQAAIVAAKKSPDAEVIFGGGCDKSKGFFIEPTVIWAKTPDYITLREELFGPVLTLYIYEDADLEATLRLVDTTSPYALTGAIFARERGIIGTLTDSLRHAAGNFYINDKPTGAVVGQQPFGGARASGTNDKAGSALNLIRWTSPRTIKENFAPTRHVAYPHMA